MSLAAYERLAQSMRLPSPMELLSDEKLSASGVELWLKRDDLIHPDVPGNKWRKLKHNLMEAARSGQRTLLTFGGAYSNHIRATAAAGKYCGFSTIGIIRGEEHVPLNPSLAYAASQGMRLSYLSREEYRCKTSVEVIDNLRQEFGPFYLLPEGGSNDLAVRGCAEIPAEIDIDYDVICCPCGTGATLAGIAAGLSAGRRAIGFSALKDGGFLTRDVTDLQQSAYGYSSDNWHIECGFHFGGFARKNTELDKFIAEFAKRHGIALDWVYVAKMMYGLCSLAKERAFTPGTRVIAVITGPPFQPGVTQHHSPLTSQVLIVHA